MKTLRFIFVFGLTLLVFSLVANAWAAAWPLHPPMAIAMGTDGKNAEEEFPSVTTMLYLPRLGSVSAPTVFGLEDGFFYEGEMTNAVMNSGASWLRRNALLWSSVEPQKGQRQWKNVAGFETELKRMAGTGKELILVIRRAPEWARQYPTSGCGPIKQSEIPAFATFVADAVKRYSVSPYSIKYYEIWNEQDAAVVDDDDVYGCWGDPNDKYYGGRFYAEVLKQVYPKLKAANPEAKLVIGGLLMDCDPVNPPIDPNTGKPKNCTNSKYLEGILVGGGGPYFDVVSYHSYDYYYGALGVFQNENWHSFWNGSGPSLIAKARYIKQLLAQYNISGKTLMCTEIALVCLGSCDDTFQETKAYFLAQAYGSVILEGIKSGIWYTMINSWRDSGLMTGTFDPLPAYNAFQFGRSILNTASSGSDLSQGEVRIYEFTNSKGRIWQMWSRDGLGHQVDLPSLPYKIFDVYGNALPVTDPVQVSIKPIYIQWDAPAP